MHPRPRVTPSRSLNALQRALNRAGRGFGVAFFPVAWESNFDEPITGKQSLFDQIARDNFWGSSESISGPGSELARTSRYRQELINFLQREQISSFFDAPCGDLNWMSDLLAKRPMRYIGGDISPAVIALARKRHSTLDLREIDICRDDFPSAQVWHCRDAFLHLSFADIWAALSKAAQSSADYALLTTYRARILQNLDIQTGGWRYIDLERPPFNLPKPLEYLNDSYRGEFPRAVGVWCMDAIRKALVAASSQ